jgi:hypothetical protein
MMRPGKRHGEAKGSILGTLRVILRDLVGYKTPAGTFRARAAFVTDPAAKTSLGTATYWAERLNYVDVEVRPGDEHLPRRAVA